MVRGRGDKPLRRLAGAPGLEPGNGGIKIRCLTAWLRPIVETSNEPVYTGLRHCATVATGG